VSNSGGPADQKFLIELTNGNTNINENAIQSVVNLILHLRTLYLIVLFSLMLETRVQMSRIKIPKMFICHGRGMT